VSGRHGDKPPPPADESGTVFRPGVPAPPEGEGRDDPAAAPEAGAETGEDAPGWERTVPPIAAAPAQPGSCEPRAARDGIRVGDVLNHIFEVKRFIARGGMGEVFEGCNVNSEERVAIKVMLPSLAQDPNVISMFRKEARTLTRLQHEALVQYRVLAQEPQLGVLYIVTEFIDGITLSGTFGSNAANPDTFETLLRRLASGLRAAHALGAIHRDMAPDNVLLEGGRLGEAKIVDFGIAKDLDPGSKTIVGEGFAGKLNYVAPEQLGDFGREIGPWTDVYSLGLVMLAFVRGRDVEMGGTLVDAVDKRRAGVDVSAAPERLRPVLERMLRPDPAARFRSMDEVLAALDRPPQPLAAPAGPPPPPKRPSLPAALPKKGLLIAGGAVGTSLLVIAAAFFLSRGTGGSQAPVEDRKVPPAPVAEAPARSADPVEVARTAIDKAFPAMACSWLDITDLGQAGGRLAVRITGVAGAPTRAQDDISNALAGAGLNSADIDFSEVAQIEPAGCSALDAYRQVRVTDAARLSVQSRTFEMEAQEGGLKYAKPVLRISMADPGRDFAVAGIEPSGKITTIIRSRAQMREEVELAVRGDPVADLGDDTFQLLPATEHLGWSGILLVTGTGPFDDGLIAPPVTARSAEWRQRFLDTARRQGWRAEMVWFKSVDERPD
jgi:eukaryotic-like serine/threonine-protein kinase